MALPANVSAGCNIRPVSCPPDTIQYYMPSNNECPDGNFSCVSTVKNKTPASVASKAVTSTRNDTATTNQSISSPDQAQIIASLRALVVTLTQRLADLVAARQTENLSSPATVQLSTVSIPLITRTLAFGSKGDDVTQLQYFLISQNLLLPDSATGYFGALTEVAVQKFQSRNGIVSSGTPGSTGYGVVGSKTRAAMSLSTNNTVPIPPGAGVPGTSKISNVDDGAAHVTVASSSMPSTISIPVTNQISGLVASTTHVTTVLPPSTSAQFRGALDHIGLAWIEGYACDANNYATPNSVEVYASGTSGDGIHIQYNGSEVYRIAVGVANKDEFGRATLCGGNTSTGFHIATPSSILDRHDHTVVVFV